MNFDQVSIIQQAPSDKVDVIDAYLAHNSKDKDFVREIFKALETLGVKTWFDERDFPKVGPGIDAMSKALRSARRLVLFFGQQGSGPIQDLEIHYALRHADKVVVVLLPDVVLDKNSLDEKLVLFCGFYHHRFTSADDSRALEELRCALLSKRVVEGKPAHDSVAEVQAEARQALLNKARASKPPMRREIDEPPNHYVGPDAGTELQKLKRLARELAESISNTPLVLFVGSHLIEQQIRTLGSYRIARELLRGLQMLDTEPGRYLPCLSTSSLVYAVKSGGEKKLDDYLENLLTKDIEGIPTTYQAIAALVSRLRARRSQEELTDGLGVDVVVTTSIDLLLEAALLHSRIPFTMLVADRRWRAFRCAEFHIEDDRVELHADRFAGRRWWPNEIVKGPVRLDSIRDLVIDPDGRERQSLFELVRSLHIEWMNKHASYYAKDGERVKLADLLDRRVNLVLGGARNATPIPLIVVHLNGLCAWPESYLLSLDHYFEALVLPAPRDLMPPNNLVAWILQNPKLFVGYSLLDADFRQLYYRCFNNRGDGQGKCVVVQEPRVELAMVQATHPAAESGGDAQGSKDKLERALAAAATWNVITAGKRVPADLGAEIVIGQAIEFLNELDSNL